MKIRRLCCVAAVSCLVFVLPQALIADPLDNWHLRYTVTLSHNLGMHLFYGGGFFVATGANGQIATSPDGVTWTERVSGVTADLSAGAYGNGTFVIFGDGGLVLTSPDGVNWTPKYLDPTIIGNAVIYANGLFACACNDGRIVTSPDGFSWAVKNTGAPSFLSGITYGNGLFVAV
ncbi:MAG TPA: hypothetical protein VKF36_04425, partial [Syntrophorhabdales bacterium]|nr:hypothetical protein [Syntrophorhabdales bacterium]